MQAVRLLQCTMTMVDTVCEKPSLYDETIDAAYEASGSADPGFSRVQLPKMLTAEHPGRDGATAISSRGLHGESCSPGPAYPAAHAPIHRHQPALLDVEAHSLVDDPLVVSVAAECVSPVFLRRRGTLER